MVSKSQHMPRLQGKKKKFHNVSCSFFFAMPSTCAFARDEIAKAFKTSLAMSSLRIAFPFHFTHLFENKNYYLNLLNSFIKISLIFILATIFHTISITLN